MTSQRCEKRICFFAPNLKGGGAERVISMLATHYSTQAECEVDLILLESTGPYLANIPDSVNIKIFNCRKASYALPKLVKYLRNHTPEILFTSHIHFSTIALLAAQLAQVKTRIIIRQPTMLMPKYSKASISKLIRQKLFLKLAKSADTVIVSSKAMQDEFLALSDIDSNNVATIYNPLPINNIEQQSYERVDHPWYHESSYPVILSVGRLVTVKDFSTLIKAFSIVNQQTPCRLMILGEGPLRFDLQKLINDLDLQESVELAGFSSNPFKYMRQSNVYVLSSLWEGFPNSLVEAMACNVPIVATNCEGGTSEILNGGSLGKLVPVRDKTAMAKAILESLEDPNTPTYDEKLNEFLAENIFRKYDALFLL